MRRTFISLIFIGLVFVSGCTAWSVESPTSKLTVISLCKDVDVNDLKLDPNTGLWQVGSISSHTSGLTEGIIGAAAAIIVTAP